MRYDSNTGFTVADLPTATDIVTGASKGTNLASDVTATAVDSNHTGLDVVVPAGVSIAPGSTVTATQGAAGGSAWPVSAATLPLPSGAATEASLASLLARLPTALVGGRLDVNIGAPATLPVSLASVPSHAVTVAQLPAALVGGRLDVNVGAPATLPVSAASLPLPAGAAQEHVTAAGFHSVRLTDGAAFYDGRDITDRAARLVGHITVDNTSLTVAQATAASLAATVTQGPAGTVAASWPIKITDGTNTSAVTAKGTQGAFGQTVQQYKDSGRVNIMWTAEFAATAVAEALLTLTESRDGGGTTTFTTKVITAGKRLRITSLHMTAENTLGTSIQRAYLRLRVNSAGAVTATSPLQGVWSTSAAGTVKSISTAVQDDFPDGIEFVGDGTRQIGFTMTNPDWVSATSTVTTRVVIFCFEY